jgi:hypothetical protein
MLVLFRAAPSCGPGTSWRQGVGMDDDDDYNMIDEVMHYVTIIFLVLMTITFIAGLAGFVWGML